MDQSESYILRCSSCGAKNRIPKDKVSAPAKCGKCASVFQTNELLIDTPIVVSEAVFEDRVLKSQLPVLLDCWAAWCGPCQMVAPILDQLAREWKGKAKVCKLNVDENPSLSETYQIQSIPTLMIFDKGEVKDTLIGALPKKQIIKAMTPFFL